MVTVIGIDPGLAETGYGVVKGIGLKANLVAYSTVTTSSRDPLPDRLRQIYAEIKQTLQLYRPALMVVEDVFFLKQYPKSGIILGKVSGVILLAGAGLHLPVLEIPVREAKQVLTGNGNSSKQQLEKSVRSLLNMDKKITPFHASDGLALALIGLFRHAPELSISSHKTGRSPDDGAR